MSVGGRKGRYLRRPGQGFKSARPFAGLRGELGSGDLCSCAGLTPCSSWMLCRGFRLRRSATFRPQAFTGPRCCCASIRMAGVRARDVFRYLREHEVEGSRVTEIGLVAAAGLWIVSGHFLPHETAESRAAVRAGEDGAKKLFRVAVVGTTVVPHSRKLTVAGRTEADKRVTITARTGGVLTDLKVKRGMWVKKGDVIAVLSDEAREAQVAQAQAAVTQRRTELDAKRALILNGTLPRLQLVDLEAQLKAAEAALAAAEAERDRGVVRAPWLGVVHDIA